MEQKYPLLYKTGRLLLGMAGRVSALVRKTEALPGKVPEISVLFVYAVAHLCMAAVHEPFFDEAEAWQIARSVTLKTLFFETTHYEGHPPLWHLILMPLAKAGAPYELSLTLVSLAFMGAAVFLILRYAPFPRLVRLLLPFTYFLFYQYGVISRVYCVLTFVFVLLAMTYRRRNESPGRYTAVLILMCATLAYGLVLAGGLAIVWLWEIWGEWSRGVSAAADQSGERKAKGSLCGCIADRRVWWLAVLLAAALGVIWMIMPRTDTFATAPATAETIRNPFVVRLFYLFLVLPADAALTDIYSDHIILSRVFLMPSALIGGAMVGMLIWGVFLYYGKRKKTTLLLVLPYSLFAVFSAAVYFSLHHIGIGLLYFGFWCWVTAESREQREPLAEKSSGRETALRDGVKTASILLGTLAMGISLFWTGAACKLDFDKEYALGRNEAAFIKEHNLDQYRVMSGWLIEYDAKGNVSNTDINECSMAVNLAPYFEDNLYFNFNEGRNDCNYITHMRLSEEETQERYEKWRREEPPQVLWMSPDLMTAYDGAVGMRDYVLVYQGDAEQVWKAGADYLAGSIHVRRDLLEETGLRPLQEKP